MVKKKRFMDTLGMLAVAAAIVSGVMLHNEIHHTHIYNDVTLWDTHTIAGILFLFFFVVHCLQHKPWFKSYKKIKRGKKRVTTILAALALILMATGFILMGGSRSDSVSITHYACGIIFTILAIGHVAKRWKIYKKLSF